jgi:arabinan endo-1,5-alpha-L-arabinosidase
MYPNASLSQDATNPAEYSGYMPLSGYFTAPPDVYFNGNFTITAYVYLYAVENWARLLDFANGAPMDNVQFVLSSGTSGYPQLDVFRGTEYPALKSATSKIKLNDWVHLAVTMNGTTAAYYLNGTLCGTVVMLQPADVIRKSNLIGMSNWAGNSLPNAKFRNLRIYNKGITQSAVVEDMNS